MLQHLEPCFTNDCILLCNILVNLIVTWCYALERHITFTYKHLFFSYFFFHKSFLFSEIKCLFTSCVCLDVHMPVGVRGHIQELFSLFIMVVPETELGPSNLAASALTQGASCWPWGSLLVSFVFFFKPRKEHFMLEDASSRVLPFFVIC